MFDSIARSSLLTAHNVCIIVIIRSGVASTHDHVHDVALHSDVKA